MATMTGNSGSSEPVEALALARAIHLQEQEEEMEPAEFQQYLSEYMSATNGTMIPSYREHVENPQGSIKFMEFALEIRHKVYDMSIGEVIYANSTVYDHEELDELPHESIAFGKDWHYHKKPAGALKNLLSVSKSVRFEILDHTIKTRVFLFGDIYGFLTFFRRPILCLPSFPHPWMNIRKINIMLFREGVQLLPLSHHLVDLSLEEGEDHETMPTHDLQTFKWNLYHLRLDEFKLTIRDGFALVGTAPIARWIDNGLLQDMSRWINRFNYPLQFRNGHRNCIEVEFLDDLHGYPQSYCFDI
ncbi:hypothetical protein AMS68_005373 [Peltaster fructicola]|uniref:Uncharacterized protein n=1 Tax=Peltaster fructicola TaxID=286661 RepID=A0A6H0XYU7_9PEZI|nr:hypothetical protein AMS68_005373 [Peltaster fructicola]